MNDKRPPIRIYEPAAALDDTRDYNEQRHAVLDQIMPILDEQSIDVSIDIAAMIFATAIARIQGDRIPKQQVRRELVRRHVGQIWDMTKHVESETFGNGRRKRGPRR